jgi:hypothetical protein
MKPRAFDRTDARKDIDAHGLSAVLSAGRGHGSDPSGMLRKQRGWPSPCPGPTGRPLSGLAGI